MRVIGKPTYNALTRRSARHNRLIATREDRGDTTTHPTDIQRPQRCEFFQPMQNPCIGFFIARLRLRPWR
jgi:hypothetical protein